MAHAEVARRINSETEMNAGAERPAGLRTGMKHQAFPDRDSLIPHEGKAQNDSVRVLHIVPFIYLDEEYLYLGSRKDIDGRQQYLSQCGVAYDTFLHLKDRRSLADELSFFSLPEYTHIIVDLSKTADELAYLKRRWPQSKLIVRSHNPEVAHRIDYIRATRRVKSAPQQRRGAIYNLGVFFRRERGVAEYADVILHIETANTAWYWRALGFRGDVIVAPYFTSDFYIERMPRGSRREKQIVCLGSSHPGPLISEMMRNYHRATAALEGRAPDFDFLATGDLPDSLDKKDVCPRVRHLGYVDGVLTLLTDTFAVAVTSSLGRGFKTKILEAINCGAWVIVSRGLMRRMPDVLKPYCASLDRRNSGDSLADAIADLSERRWPAGDPNAVLREQSYHALDAALFGEPEKTPASASDERTRAALTMRSET
ncbi:MAG: glycosyltransferase [Parvularculaceae bacterium]